MRSVFTGFLLAGLGMVASAPTRADELRATFIGNMAFHITDGRVSVFFDFPYQSGAFGYMEWSKALAPAGPAPLCVITHAHDDHFAPFLARDYCEAILGPKDIASGTGVPALEMKEQVSWRDLSIRPLRTPHGGTEHYSYLVEWGGRRLYFTGDTDDSEALLATRHIDVAFVTPWLLKALEALGRRIDARQVVVYHHRAGEAVPQKQGRLVPKQGDVLGLGNGTTPVRVIEAGPDVMPKAAEPDAFAKRLKEATENVQTPDGRAYFEGPFNKQFFPTYAPRLSQCMQQETNGELKNFDLVLILGADGRVQKAVVRPQTRITTCFMALVEKDVFPPPPRAGFLVPLTLTFTKP
jgi:L-ascorbate metabolism protein UlaG (beta-lactamase superfamily)